MFVSYHPAVADELIAVAEYYERIQPGWDTPFEISINTPSLALLPPHRGPVRSFPAFAECLFGGFRTGCCIESKPT